MKLDESLISRVLILFCFVEGISTCTFKTTSKICSSCLHFEADNFTLYGQCTYNPVLLLYFIIRCARFQLILCLGHVLTMCLTGSVEEEGVGGRSGIRVLYLFFKRIKSPLS